MDKFQINTQVSHIVEGLLEQKGNYHQVSMGQSIIPPHTKLPETGYSEHAGDEYSIIINGQLFGESGGKPFEIQEGELSFIPKGEVHWCENRSDEPVTLFYIMVE
ncbi:cupin [Suicoccus acidiformans]|uniref:Cupin n=1 Tax=Suicoccus acidiformans TaxID=2036206 RepID=A0A347WKS5_9LACT|nr:cupin domain-containing protein [Suicoccus acidiformans]AXY25682.1 cupin [Suicoccus acidiformans]